MATVRTRVDGHTILAVPCPSIFHDEPRWLAMIDPHLPTMEREFELRSTYTGPLDSILNAAACDILGMSIVIKEGQA